MPADGRAPSFQFYPRDFYGDPVVVAMSLEEVGAYIRLLCVAWEQFEPGVLPDDDEILARFAHSTRREWRRVSEKVKAAFDRESRPGFLIQKRMMAERNAQAERYMMASIEVEETIGSP